MRKPSPRPSKESRLRLAQGFAQRLANLTQTPTCLWQHRASKTFLYTIEGWPIANARLLDTYQPQTSEVAA